MTYLFFMYMGAVLLTAYRLFPEMREDFQKQTLKIDNKEQYYWKMFDYFGLWVFESLKLKKEWN